MRQSDVDGRLLVGELHPPAVPERHSALLTLINSPSGLELRGLRVAQHDHRALVRVQPEVHPVTRLTGPNHLSGLSVPLLVPAARRTRRQGEGG